MTEFDEAAAVEAARRESRKTVWDYAPGTFRDRFVSPYEQFRERIGQRFTVLRELTDGERDPEVGPMYRVRFEDGTEIDAWGEEVCVESAPPAEGGTHEA